MQQVGCSVPRVPLLGTHVDALAVADLYSLIERAVACGRRFVIGNHNLHSIALLHKDPQMRKFYDVADSVFVDGMAVIAFGRVVGVPLGREHRMTSVDWFIPFLRRIARRNWRVFLLGSAPGVPERAAAVFQRESPGTQFATHHGYFDFTPGSTAGKAVLSQILDFRPHLLLVGMGMPRQERWIVRELDSLPDAVIMNLGAFMDYVAGVVPTPPRWMSRMGLEWLYRMYSDPSRLAYRYLVEPWTLLPLMMRDVVGYRLGSYRGAEGMRRER
jgi:N-acetylglucosaminyldiphosphoundecaprenol N-acetyl-beta-D-mannosaminyltransferase